jgi:gamma-polyglutamate biosynthesis protein CapA
MKKIMGLTIVMIFLMAGGLTGYVLFFSGNTKAVGAELEKINLTQTDVIAYGDWEKLTLLNYATVSEEVEIVDPEVTLFTAGDIMLSRTVEKTYLAKKDFNYCFEPLTELIQSADLALANLESPIIAGATVPAGSFSFRAHPESAKALKTAGFDVLTLANNHFGNYGQNGMLKTFEYLTAQGIDYVGAGKNSAEMKNPVIKEVKGLKIAFLGYGYGPDYYAATADKAGFAFMDAAQMIKDVKALQDSVDLIIVTMHDGTEYVNAPTEHQKNFAHLAIDNGADLVIGHHPHVVQEMEIYNEKYIFYSLGNFIFDQMWSKDTRQGLSVIFTLNKDGVKDVDYYPVLIEDYCRPSIVDGKERDEIIEKL